MNYTALLFDLDGVITDTRAAVIAFWQQLAAQGERELTQAQLEWHVYGCPASHTLARLFPHLSPVEYGAVLNRLRAYEDTLTYTALPGALPFLHALRGHAVPTALVTSSEPEKVRRVDAQLGLKGLFDVVITAWDVQRGKPAPDPYLAAAHAVGRDPASCLVFEDAASGVRAAVTAGAQCIGILSSTPAAVLRAAGACTVLPGLDHAAVHALPVEAANHGPATSRTVALETCVILLED